MNINGFHVDNILNITPKEAYRLCIEEGAAIIDVREPELREYKQFDIPKVFYFRLKDIVNQNVTFPSEPLLIFADATGLRSKQAAAYAKNAGLQNIANMAGGIIEWDRDGLPLKVDHDKRMSDKKLHEIKQEIRQKYSKDE
ncbi:MAG TPA: rhodanese-like domain-containing protein [Salinivirgaceae bacterium]|nr:rhodanese-like domain-containing protein [Salinivirgaceae bacterium]